MTAVSAHDVAAELRRRLPGVGTKKLHKLLYYCQGHHLATFNGPLFNETISAWDMGPVVGTLWHPERERDDRGASSAALTEGQLNTVGYVVSRYGALSGADLEHLTHCESPWQEADRQRPRRTSAKITLESIHAYFTSAESDEGDEDTPLPDADAVAKWLASVPAQPSGNARPDSIEGLRARLAPRGRLDT
jgi:uncharacterized phage-associated protein